MKQYQCHKKVHGEPMTRGEFAGMVGKTVVNADPTEPGYKVIYSKDTADEYTSWSPKKAFEDGYTEL